MPANTPAASLPYPLPEDPVVDYPALGRELAEDLDSMIVLPYCRLRHSANIVIAAGQTPVLNFDTENEDPFGMHDPANNSRVNIPRNGIYVCELELILTATQAGSPSYSRIRRNGGVYLGDVSPPLATGYLTPRMVHTSIAHFVAGDYVEALFSNNTGASITLSASPSGSGLWLGVFCVAIVP